MYYFLVLDLGYDGQVVLDYKTMDEVMDRIEKYEKDYSGEASYFVIKGEIVDKKEALAE